MDFVKEREQPDSGGRLNIQGTPEHRGRRSFSTENV